MSKKIAAYLNLAEPEKSIVRFLAIAYEPLARSTILNCFRRVGIKSAKGILYTHDTLTQQLAALQALGLVRSLHTELTLFPELIFFSAKEAMAAGDFTSISEHLLREIPVHDSWSAGDYRFKRYLRFLRHLRFRLFQNDPEPILNEIIHQGYQEFSADFRVAHPIVTLFATPFAQEYLQLFSAPVQHFALSYLLYEAKMRLQPGQHLVDALLESLTRNPKQGAEAHGQLAHYLTLWGRWREAERHLPFLPAKAPEDFLGLAGWQQTLAGHDQEAIALFSRDYALLLKLTGKRKVFFADISGAFFIVALLRSGEPAHLAKAGQYLNLIDSIKYHPLQGYTPYLRRGLALLQGLPAENKDGFDPNFFRSNELSPANHFFKMVADYWEDRARCRKQWGQALAELRDRARRAGQQWLAMETSELLARLGIEEKSNHALAEGIRQECQLASVIDMIAVVDPWERTLKALINLADQPQTPGRAGAKEGEPGQRLVWLFAHDERDGLCEIFPRLQLRNKSGKWSGGRAVALKTLAEEHGAMPGLEPQDRAICGAIRRDYESGYYRGYRKEVYSLQMEVALGELVNHPLLFLADSPGTRIDLVAGEPELLVTHQKGKIEVRIHPNPSGEGSYQMVKETPTRYKLVRFSPRHQAIAAILQKGLRAPGQAEQLTSKAISALSSLITIHSDLDGGTANSREVEADPRPHLHLLPYQEGLKAELLVKPLAGAEVWYRPGVGGQKVFAEVEGEKLHAARALAREKELAAAMVKACPTLAQQEENEGEYLIPTPEESLELLLELHDLGAQALVQWPQGQSFRLRGRAAASALAIQVNRERDWFKASGTLTIDETGVIALQKLLGLLDQAKGRFVLLDDGSFLALSKEFRNRLEELRAYGEKHGDGVRFSPLAAFGLEELSQEAGEFKGDRHWKKHLARISELVDPEIPSTLQAELRDYQVTGFKWLAQLAHWGVGACLADDMGLGKTIQALAALLRLAPEGPSLVVAPLSVLMNWQDEATRFAPTLRVILFGAGDRQQILRELQPFDLLICSYGLLQTEAEKLGAVAWQTIVLDEAQAIKNMNTKRAKAATSLNGKFKVITTGTPVENHLGELWSLFDFITPGLLGTFPHFNRAFMSTVNPEADKKARARLKKLIQPFILRRLKSQVLQELPARTEITLRVEMSGEEAALYEAQRRSAVEKLAELGAEPEGQKQFRIFAEIMRLRRLCCNPSLVLPNCGIESSKLKVFAELLTDILDNRHKALVFSQFVDHLQILAQFLEQRGIAYQYLDGSTPAATRKKRVNEFQAGQGDLFLISLKAGGSGLNLTAADYVIHMDPWWNPAVEDQASDRAHRIGQLRPVTIYRLVMAESIEEQIIKLHRDKRDLADSLLAGGDLSGKMSAAELLGLLQESGK